VSNTHGQCQLVRQPVSLSISLVCQRRCSVSVYEPGVHYTRTVSVIQTVIQSVSQSGVSTLVQVYCVKSGVHYTRMVSVIQTVIQSVSQSGVSTPVQVYCVKSRVHYTHRQQRQLDFINAFVE